MHAPTMMIVETGLSLFVNLEDSKDKVVRIKSE